MSVVTITITVTIPEGATVAIGAPQAPVAAPQATQAPVVMQAAPGVAHELWPAGECPKHHKPWKPGNYGDFCSSKDDSQPKGYCSLKPGDLFQGKVAA